MLIQTHPQNPDQRKIKQVVELLKQDQIIIYPTDSVYAVGCSLHSSKAIEKLCAFAGMKLDKAKLSIICSDIAQVSEFTKPISNRVFRLLKQCLPGPFTFILQANNNTPKVFRVQKKREIGIRIPANQIPISISQMLGHPMITTSLHSDDGILEYIADAELIYEQFKNKVGAVVDGGVGALEPSTIIDCTTDEPSIVRQGIGHVEL